MLWVKAFHIIAVVTWFAALFYLPRLFVYHAQAKDPISKERFCIMERKLYRGIATPSMIIVILLGAVLSQANFAYYSQMTWYWLKLLLVAILIGYHHACGVYVSRFQHDTVKRSHVYFRFFNEFPVLILIGAVILVVVRPFQ